MLPRGTPWNGGGSKAGWTGAYLNQWLAAFGREDIRLAHETPWNTPIDSCRLVSNPITVIPPRKAAHASRRIPRHVGFIPDGNRRWAAKHGLAQEDGYANGIAPGLALFEACRTLGIGEVSVFGFTQDNTRRPSVQSKRFRAACVAFAFEIARRGAALLVVGDA